MARKGIPKSEIKSNYINENFLKHVKPHITKRLTALLEISWDTEAIRNMSKNELVTLVTSLSRSANAKISRYKKSEYYQQTKEANPNADLRDVKPTPIAYQNVFEKLGTDGKFDIKGIKTMSMGELKRTLNTLNHFLSSESSLMGKVEYDKEGNISKDSFGFQRIMQERLNAFTNRLSNITGVNKDIIQSERFSKMFWETYNKVSELGHKYSINYDKEQFLSMIAEEVYPYAIMGKWGDNDIEQLVSKISGRLNTLYEKQRLEEEDDDEFSITPQEFRTGKKG